METYRLILLTISAFLNAIFIVFIISNLKHIDILKDELDTKDDLLKILYKEIK